MTRSVAARDFVLGLLIAGMAVPFVLYARLLALFGATGLLIAVGTTLAAFALRRCRPDRWVVLVGTLLALVFYLTILMIMLTIGAVSFGSLLADPAAAVLAVLLAPILVHGRAGVPRRWARQ